MLNVPKASCGSALNCLFAVLFTGYAVIMFVSPK